MKLVQSSVVSEKILTPTSYKLSIRGKRMSSIAIMSTKGIEDVDIYDSCINGEIFTNFIARSLLPILQPFDGKSPGTVASSNGQCIHTPGCNIDTEYWCNSPVFPSIQPCIGRTFCKSKGIFKS